jgi:hypothetical protein
VSVLSHHPRKLEPREVLSDDKRTAAGHDDTWTGNGYRTYEGDQPPGPVGRNSGLGGEAKTLTTTRITSAILEEQDIHTHTGSSSKREGTRASVLRQLIKIVFLF